MFYFLLSLFFSWIFVALWGAFFRWITTENDGNFLKKKITNLACPLEISNDVVALLGLLETIEGHLGARDVLLGVLEIVEQGLIRPDHALVLVGVRVRKPGRLTRLAAYQAVQVGTDLVDTALKQKECCSFIQKRGEHI